VIYLSPFVTREDVENESRAIDKLRTDTPHAHIVRIFRHGWLKSVTRQNAPLPMYFIDMELGDVSLEAHLKDLPGIPKRYDVFYIMLQVTAGLSFIHRNGMIHRDIKPANSRPTFLVTLIVIVILVGRGSRGPYHYPHWKITDFGISTIGTSKRLIATRDARGTAHYCAPEILLSEAEIPSYTNKVDIWSVGLLLYELCTNKPMFQSANAVMRYFWEDQSIPRIPDIDHGTLISDRGKAYRRDISEVAVSISHPFVISESSLSENFNECLKLLLQRDQQKRPSIENVNFHFAALRLYDAMEVLPSWSGGKTKI